MHTKTKKFLAKYQLSIEDLNEILYKENGTILPLFDDLKTTKTSESQLRIALLQALILGIETGDFTFDGEQVRRECQLRKCYDSANFTSTFKNNAVLFDNFEKYDKETPLVRLSEEGRKRLAEVIKDLK